MRKEKLISPLSSLVQIAKVEFHEKGTVFMLPPDVSKKTMLTYVRYLKELEYDVSWTFNKPDNCYWIIGTDITKEDYDGFIF